jgi:hypothetical protein
MLAFDPRVAGFVRTELAAGADGVGKGQDGGPLCFRPVNVAGPCFVV